MKPSLLVLAAGMGSRYGGNKQLDKVGPSGETIIDYSIYDAIRAGFGKIVFVIRRDIEQQINERFINKLKDKIEIDYVFQDITDTPEGVSINPDRTKPWGTSHAILVAKNKINEPFGVINSDDYYGQGAFEVLYNFLTSNKNDHCYSIIGYKLGNTLSDNGTVNRGICKVSEDGNLLNIVETREIAKTSTGALAPNPIGGANNISFSGEEFVSMNLWGFMPSCFDILDKEFQNFISTFGMELKTELDIPSSMDKHVKNGSIVIKVIPTNEKWFGVTYKEDKPFVVDSIRKKVQEGIYPFSIY